MDSRSDIYGSLSFLNSGLDLFKLDMDSEKITWQRSYGQYNYTVYPYGSCFSDDEEYLYVGTELNYEAEQTVLKCMPSDVSPLYSEDWQPYCSDNEDVLTDVATYNRCMPSGNYTIINEDGEEDCEELVDYDLTDSEVPELEEVTPINYKSNFKVGQIVRV